MDENQLHNLSKKLFNNYQMEKLPDDFTEKLMVSIEQAKIKEKQVNPLFNKKFLLIFAFTFLSIFAIGYFFQDNGSESGTISRFVEKINVPSYDFGKILKLLNFDMEVSLFLKLIIISMVVLVVIDQLTGSILDRFIDSKTKKEEP